MDRKERTFGSGNMRARWDAALRPVLAGRDMPLILAATGRLESVFRSVNSYPNLLPQSIEDSPDRITDEQLAALAVPILDAAYHRDVDTLCTLFEQRAGNARATVDLSDAARAATFGAVEYLLVDIDATVPGTIDQETGAVNFAGRRRRGELRRDRRDRRPGTRKRCARARPSPQRPAVGGRGRGHPAIPGLTDKGPVGPLP